ncbi:MAG: membrane dipeptidase, partial [Anaerolineae bacterium]|nr:membrane dipeptidase [Anaerolineae bacterium]
FAERASQECGFIDHPQTYNSREEAHQIYWGQLQCYHRLVEEHPDKFYLIQTQADLTAGLTWWEQEPGHRRVGLVLLMEGAEGIRHPDDVGLWFEQGVRIIGPAWGKNHYAGGAGDPGPFSGAGRDLLTRMAAYGLILDLSHLAEVAIYEALADYPGPIVATHSNARALLPSVATPQRHLKDEMVRQIATRGGVIGLNLFNPFIKDGVKIGDPRNLVSVDDLIDHIDHYCQLVGHANHLGLGSDLDGGFGLNDVPTGIDSIADLPRLGEALNKRGYSATEVEAILGQNWVNLLQRTLPE